MTYCAAPAPIPDANGEVPAQDYYREVMRIDSQNTAVIAECYRIQRGLVDAVIRRH